MAKLFPIQNSFEWGELSDRLFARIDLEAYRKGTKTMFNAYPFQQGGVRRRPGTRFVGEIVDAYFPVFGSVRLFPITVSSSANFMVLMFADETTFAVKLQFINANTGAFVESSPGVRYTLTISGVTAGAINSLKFCQFGNSLIFTGSNVQPYLLRYTSATNWSWETIKFLQYAQGDSWYENVNVRFKVLTGTVPFRTDLGRGYGDRFTAVVNSSGAITSITKDFQDPDGDPTNNNPGDPGYDSLVIPSDGTIVFDQTDITTATAQTYTITCVRLEGERTYWTVSGSVSGSCDGSASAIPPFNWTTNNYPQAVTAYQGRLWFGGTAKDPTTVWGSSLTLYSDFTLGTRDDEACQFQVQADSFDGIVHMSAGRLLLIFTVSNEFSAQGGNDLPITPTNILVQPQTAHGASTNARPVRVGKQVLFAQRNARRLRATSYSVADDQFIAPDITLFAEQVGDKVFARLGFAQDPDYLLWTMLVNDGTLASCTIRDTGAGQTVGWARHEITGATCTDVAVIKTANRTDVYFTTYRVINGNAVAYVERLDYSTRGDGETEYVTVDCAKVFGDPSGDTVLAPGSEVTSLTGLSHLEGEEVTIVVDGKYHPNKTVTSGGVTLDFGYAEYAVVGKGFESEVELLHPEVGDVNNSLQGHKVSPHEIIIRFKDTVNCTINYGAGDYQIPFQSFPVVANAPIPPYTGDKVVAASGWRSPFNLKVKQATPFPWTILGIIMKLSVNQT
jgi:hypothetical protein